MVKIDLESPCSFLDNQGILEFQNRSFELMNNKKDDLVSVLALLPGVVVNRIKDEMFLRDVSKSETVQWLLLQAWERRREIILDNRSGPFDTHLICYQPSGLVRKVRVFADENQITMSVALQKLLEDGLEQATKVRKGSK